MKRRFLLPLVGLALFGTVLSSCGQNEEQQQKQTEMVTITVVNGSGSGSYEKGKLIAITTVPPEGKDFVCWKKNGQIVSLELTYIFNANEDATYEAVFVNHVDPQKATITVVGGTGSGSYDIGSNATIVATPPQGKVFVNWTHNGNVVSTEASYTFVVTESGTYIATFKNQEEPVTKVTITVEGGSGSGTYNVGTSITITATPVQGKTFIGWMHNGNIVSNQLEYTFTVTESGTYSATFANGGIENYEKVVTKKSNQDFKILSFTDVQLHDGEDYSIAEHVIETLVEREQPDFIVFLGDLLNDDRTYKSVVNAKKFIAQIDSYDIPWAPILGNHDNEDYQPGYESAKTTTSAELCKWYSEADNCVFTYGPTEIPGKSNYFVTVKDETTQKPVQTLIFLDSRLSGLQDAHDIFYREVINYSKAQNNGFVVPSTLFTHIALPEYGDEYAKARACDYANIVGSINRDPCDLASGTKLIYQSIKELGSTDMVVCGHDHENAYYTVNDDGITLAYSMKSSQGDKYTNFAELGGSLVTINDEGKNIRYVKDLSNPMNLTGTSATKGDYPTFPDTLPNWRFSGAKLCFDIEVPEVGGSLKFNIEGTNIYRPNQDEKTRLGEWNRLTKNVDIIGGASATADFGTLTKKEGYKYSYELDLTKIPLNDSGGEESYGSETARLVYFNSIVGNFKVTNLRYEMENITEKDQIDLATATVDPIAVQFTNGGLPVRPTPTVKVGGQNLAFADDFYVAFENNFETGTAKGTILPSGKGAHKYKGYKEFTFELVENPDDDKVPGHEGATLVESNYTFEGKNFVGDLGIKDWYNGDKVLQFDVKPLVYGKVYDGETARFALFGHNGNLEKSEGNWDRFTTYYHIDFDTKSIHETGKTSEPYTICHFNDIGDGWYQVSMPLNKFVLNDGALGNDKETIKLIYIEYVKRSFKIGNFKVIGGEEEPEKSFEFKMDDSEFVVANFTDIHVDNESYLSESGTVAKTIKYGIQDSNPDIMVFSGDIAGKASDVTLVCNFLDQFKIPYFFILGNHDHEGSLGYDAISSRVNESQYGHIEYGPSNLNSQGNYTIQIKNTSDELVHGLVLMDTGNKCNTQSEDLIEYVQNPVDGVPYASYNSKKVYCNPGWNGLRGNQIDWYEKTVKKLDCETTLICHIPLLEHVKAYEQYKDALNKGDSAKIAESAPIGPCHMGESSCGSMEQLGMFDAIKRNGSTKNVICGHDHVNDFSLMYQGVRLTYAVKTGEGSYWKQDGSICGYTKLVIDSEGKTTLDQVFYNPLTH